MVNLEKNRDQEQWIYSLLFRFRVAIPVMAWLQISEEGENQPSEGRSKANKLVQGGCGTFVIAHGETPNRLVGLP